MKDTVIKGSGNSMSIRSVPNLSSLAPTYEDFLRLLSSDENGLPIDLGPLNPAGCNIVGDALNKANLLKDATAALYGKTAEATPDEIFAAIRTLVTAAQTDIQTVSSTKGNCFIQTGSYAGSGNTSSGKTIGLSRAPYALIVMTNTRTSTVSDGFCIAVRSSNFAVTAPVNLTSLGVRSVTWAANSVTVAGGINVSGYTYYYVALEI